MLLITWEIIAGMDMDGDEVLTKLQENIQWALDEDADPGPMVALALVREVQERKELEESLKKVSSYFLGLENRLRETGLSFGESDVSLGVV